MTRDVTSLYIEDLSQFTKSLRSGLIRQDDIPGHLALLGLIAKSAGHKNYQTLKTIAPAPTTTPKSTGQMKKALRSFDDQGVMIRWPKQMQVQGLCLWIFWADLPSGRAMPESEVNEILKAHSSFGDHVLMRRSLIDHRLARREIDGRAYYRIEQKPPTDALELIREIRARRG